MKPQIILASASTGRKGLLEKLGVSFTVQVSDVDEEKINDQDPYTRITNRARAKAEAVVRFLSEQAERVEDDIRSKGTLRLRSGKNSNPQSLTPNFYLIIAADSEALLEGKTYGKSKDKDHARQIVSALMGNTHEFLTATCIILLENGKEIKRFEDLTKSYVSMRKMNPEELEDYISRYDFTRFAAGYTLNETPWDLITKIEGSYTSVVGLPFEVILPLFRQFSLL